MRVRIGPVGLSLDGVLTVRERDAAGWKAAVHAEANDRKLGGGLHADAFMLLDECDAEETELLIDAEVRLLGKLGEFGQPIIRRKAETTLAEFARNVTAAARRQPDVAARPHGRESTARTGSEAQQLERLC